MKATDCYVLVLAGFAASFASGCQDCDVSGCEALEKAAVTDQVTQGVAGAVVSGGDTEWTNPVGQTCRECRFGRGSVAVWQAAGPITSAEDALAACADEPPLATMNADPWFEVSLPVGDYLGCEASEPSMCTGFSVYQGQITTLHVTVFPFMEGFYIAKPGEIPTKVDEPFYVSCYSIPL